jgi:hypothetical protein
VAARRQRHDEPVATELGDVDAVDPVEAADVDDGDELDAAGLSELEEDLDDEDAFAEDDEDTDTEDDEERLEVPLEEGLVPGEEDEPTAVPAVPAEAAFDDDDEARVVAAVVNEDDDDGDDVDGLRDEEFVCRSCYMAKRDSQLADPERMLCRDCA